MRATASGLTLLTLCSVLTGCVSGTDESGYRAEYVEKGQEVIELIRSKQFQSVAARLHYPSRYTPQELEKDQADVSRALAFLASEFGPFGTAEPATGVSTFYYLEVMGGDRFYWQKQEKTGRGGFVRYRTEFERLGPGFLKVAFYKRDDVLEIRSVSFELDTAQSRARDKIVEVGRRMMTALQSPEPPKAK